jgi:hypothetical protein
MRVQILNWLSYILEVRISHEVELFLNKDENVFRLSFKDSDLKILVDFEPLLYELTNDLTATSLDFEWISGEEKVNLVFVYLELFRKNNIVVTSGNTVHIRYDFLGLIFWMLNRIEEYNFSNYKDIHNRFTAKDSVLYEGKFYLRPIVDEWITFIRNLVQFHSPKTKLNRYNFSFRLSHDVDRPFRYLYTKYYLFIWRSVSDLIKKKISFTYFLNINFFKIFKSKKLSVIDVYNNFDELISLARLTKYTSTYFFMAGMSHNPTDPDYKLNNIEILELAKKIIGSGNRIGLHPSYNTYTDRSKLEVEVNNIKTFFSKLGISVELASRMHYLRFKFPETLLELESLGVDVDETLGFSDSIGFRCGTSHDYFAYNLFGNEKMKIKIRPLHAMQWTINSPSYMNLNIDDGFIQLERIISEVKKHDGQFNYLIHNDEFYELGTAFQERLIKILING